MCCLHSSNSAASRRCAVVFSIFLFCTNPRRSLARPAFPGIRVAPFFFSFSCGWRSRYAWYFFPPPSGTFAPCLPRGLFPPGDSLLGRAAGGPPFGPRPVTFSLPPFTPAVCFVELLFVCPVRRRASPLLLCGQVVRVFVPFFFWRYRRRFFLRLAEPFDSFWVFLGEDLAS